MGQAFSLIQYHKTIDMNTRMLFAIMAMAGLVATSSCTKEPLDNMTEEESRIYITNRDSSVDFGSYKTFSIVDSISVIDDSRLVGKEISSWDAGVLSAIRSEMEERGFTYVARNADPDLGINVSRLYNTYTGVVSYPNYWGGYGGFYDPFYWGYGGMNYFFPPSYGVYQVTEGALSVDMLDLKNANASNQIKGVWTGLIRGTGIFRSGNVNTQVQALFDQSPYLRTQQ